jgi:hypothetical protein
MGHPPPGITEQSRAHELQLILRSTQSLLAYHAPYIDDRRSLRVLDLALLNAIADLQEIDASQPGETYPRQRVVPMY